MSMWNVVFLVLHGILCVFLIGVVLVQRSEGGALGIGGGAGGNLLSGRGATHALGRATMWLGGAFFATSFLLTFLATRQADDDGLFSRGGTPAPAAASGTAPAPSLTIPAPGAAPELGITPPAELAPVPETSPPAAENPVAAPVIPAPSLQTPADPAPAAIEPPPG